jgi:hypothetical protein
LFYFKYKVFSKRRLGDGEEGEEEEMVSHCVAEAPSVVASGATRRGGTRRQGDKETRGQGEEIKLLTPNS